mgnify:CR=1 FL=1
MASNHSTNWGLNDIGSSPNALSEIYRGSSPASEPEVIALQKKGDPAGKVDLLILGDGYTAAQQAQRAGSGASAPHGSPGAQAMTDASLKTAAPRWDRESPSYTIFFATMSAASPVPPSLPSTTMKSGVMPACSQANSVPVRPKPTAISSAIRCTPWRSQAS